MSRRRDVRNVTNTRHKKKVKPSHEDSVHPGPKVTAVPGFELPLICVPEFFTCEHLSSHACKLELRHSSPMTMTTSYLG